jgi:hypothetical protein
MSKLQRLEKTDKKRIWSMITNGLVEFQPPILFFEERDGKCGLAGVMSKKYRKDRRELRKHDIDYLIIMPAMDYRADIRMEYSFNPNYEMSKNGVKLAILDYIYTAGDCDNCGISLTGVEEHMSEVFEGEDGYDTDTYMIIKLLKELVAHGVVTRTIFNTFWKPDSFAKLMRDQNIPLFKVVK